MSVADRKIIDGYRKESSPKKKYIPYSYHLTDTVISLENGDLMAVFKIDGRTHDCASDRELITWHHDLNMLVKSFGTDKVELWSHEYHRESKEYPDGVFEGIFPTLMNDYNHNLHGNSLQLINDLYLTVIYHQIGDATQKFLSKFEKPTREDLEHLQKDALEGIQEVCEQILQGMGSYGIKPLSIYYRDLNGNRFDELKSEEDPELKEVDDDDIFDEEVSLDVYDQKEPEKLYAYSQVGEFLYFLINLEWMDIPVCRERMSSYLVDNRVVSSVWGDISQIRAVDQNFYTSAVEIREYDSETEPGQLNLLKEAPFEYLLTQSFSCLSESSAKTLLENQEKSMLETRDRGQSQLEEIGNAIDMLISKKFIMGNHHATIHVFDKDQKEVQRKARKVKVMLSQCGIIGGTVGLASEAAYYAKLPGNQKWAPRPVPINSWNFLHLSPFHNFLRGKPDNNPWGPALTMFKTVSGTPLYFNFHVTPLDENSYGKRPLAHTLITGMSGEGKTTLMNFLLTQSLKFKPRMFCYDKDRGMEPFIRSVGGYYKVLQLGVPSGFSPLKQEPNKRNIAMTKKIIQICLETTNNGPLSPSAATDLAVGIDAVMGDGSLIPREKRDISMLAGYTSQNPEIASLITEWKRGGQFGWVFDNEQDNLDLSVNDVFGFDLTEFISAEGEQPSPARTPILMYLLYRVRNSIDGKRRAIQCFDEFHTYLDDPIMEREIKRGIKTDRKKDAVYLFATQEPNDALSKPIGPTVISQTITKICLRDPEAIREHYKFLTDAEFSALSSIPELSRQFLVKQGQKSALATFNLKMSNSAEDSTKLDHILSILSGVPTNGELAGRMVEQYGQDPSAWLPEYWKLAV